MKSVVRKGLLIAIASFALMGCNSNKKEDTSVKALALDATEIVLTVGQSHDFVVTFTPETPSSKIVLWTSDNACVTVNENGKAIAVKEGVANVKATSVQTGKYAVCVVTVAAGDPEVHAA